jgi:outer membrane protein assembly factor BamA
MFRVLVICLLSSAALMFSAYAFAPDSTRRIVIRSVEFEGNQKTKRLILERELLFKENDTVMIRDLPYKIERSRQNIFNTLLFNFVYAYSEFTPDSSGVKVRFQVKEAWYTWPLPIFELVDRNFNEWWLSKDLKRTNYGLYITQHNCRGRNETLNIGFRGGYTQAYDIQYTIPYITSRQNLGLNLAFSYSRNHEVVYNTRRNKLLFYQDKENFLREQWNASLRFTYRSGFFVTHSLRAGFKTYAVEDTVTRLNRDYFPVSSNRLDFPYLSYFVKWDYRDIRAYPLKGYYIDAEVQKVGFMLLKNTLDDWYLSCNLKRFLQISRRFYYAASLSEKLTIVRKQAYYNQVALGYGDLLRGYEYYVINGQHYHLFQSNLKYNLMSTRILKLKFIPTEKFNTIPNAFYVNLFFDAGYVGDRFYGRQNPMTNTLLYSYGLGLDYVTYYSTVCRIDYSINKFGEKGFFLHFTVPI